MAPKSSPLCFHSDDEVRLHCHRNHDDHRPWKIAGEPLLLYNKRDDQPPDLMYNLQTIENGTE